ncbi:MAG: glycosyltransferase, partial [Planctomycetota bacterium]
MAETHSTAKAEARPEPRESNEADPPPRPLICFAGQDWWYHNRAHSDFQLMTRLAKERPVLLVNSIGMRMPSPGKSANILRKIFRKLRSTAKLLRRPLPDVPNYWVLSPLVVPTYGSPLGRKFSAAFTRFQVKLAARWLGLRKPDVFVTVPTAMPVVRGMSHGKLIYNRSDKHSEFREADQDHIRGLEEELIARSDHVLYVNGTLLEEERDRTGDRAYLLDHGVAVDLFDASVATDEPDDLKAIAHPRVGFFGSLRPHLVDFDLIGAIADGLPDVQIVLVGDPQASTEALAGRSNIHLLGFKEYRDVPRYGAALDVALMPYHDNDWIRYSNPIKLKEYLSLGLPVVCSDLPKAPPENPQKYHAAGAHELRAGIRA